jgi:undecaprenyl-diphosphatase
LSLLRVHPSLCSIIVGCVVLFGLSTLQFLGRAHTIDQALLFGLPSPFDKGGDRVQSLIELAYITSALANPLVVASVSVIAIVLLLLLDRFKLAIYFLICVVGGTVVAGMLKSIFSLVRPHYSPSADTAILSTSFPSGHAMLATILYLTLASLTARVSSRSKIPLRTVGAFGVAIAIVLAVGVSRVYLTVHWPSDVIAGWSIGGCWIAFCWLRFRPLVSVD